MLESFQTEVKQDLAREGRVLQVVQYPHKSLTLKSAVVMSSIPHDEFLQKLILDMTATLKAYRAVGLSAIQVGVPLKLFMMQDDYGDMYTVINPQVVESSGESYQNEGCLSLMGAYTRVPRAESVTAKFFNEKGEFVTQTFTGLLARCFLHEADHLEGIMFLERMTSLQKKSMLKKLKR